MLLNIIWIKNYSGLQRQFLKICQQIAGQPEVRSKKFKYILERPELVLQEMIEVIFCNFYLLSSYTVLFVKKLNFCDIFAIFADWLPLTGWSDQDEVCVKL